MRNRQHVLGWESIAEHGGCRPRAAKERWADFQRHRSPWSDDAIQNRHANACRFNVPFLRALDRLVRAHPEISLRELSSIFRLLKELPDADQGWHSSVPTLGLVLLQIIFTVQAGQRLASERCLARIEEHCKQLRHFPDRCIVVVDETHFNGNAMTLRQGWSLVGQPLEALAPDPRAVQRYSSIVAISSNRGILELSVNEVPPTHGCEDWVLFCTSISVRMNGYAPGDAWRDQGNDCVLVYDNAHVH